MKPTAIHQTLALMRWMCIWVALGSRLSFLAFDVAAQEPTIELTTTPVTSAQEPTAVPTPTPAPTWTPGPIPTDSPPPPGAPIAPTPPNNPGATPAGRLVDFRADDDEINNGDCVQFSWVVRGDIDRVEFDQDDDNKEPLLVSALDDREECPVEDTQYILIVRWLDGTRTNQEIEIEVHTSGDDEEDGSSGSGGSSSGGSGDGTTSGGVGEFIPVTPILITTGTPTPAPVAMAPAAAENSTFQQVANTDTSSSQPAAPAGVLGSVGTLPETGAPPLLSTSPEANLMTVQPRWPLWLAFGSGFVLLLGSAGAGLVLLVRFLRQTSQFKP